MKDPPKSHTNSPPSPYLLQVSSLMPLKYTNFIDFTFLGIGMASTMLLVSLLLSLHSLQTHVFKQKSFPLFAHNIYAFSVVLANASFCCSWINRTFLYSLKWLAVSVGAGVILCAAFAVYCCMFELGSLLWPLLLVIAVSLITCAIIPQGFSVAALFCGGKGAIIALGQVLGAVISISFSFVTLLAPPRLSLTIVFSFAGLLYFVVLVMVLRLAQAPGMSHSVSVVNLTAQKMTPMKISPTAFLYRRIWVPLFHIFFTFFVTFSLFPTMSTSFTNQGDETQTRFSSMVALSAFLIGDFLGRYTPTLGLVLPELAVWPICLLRLAFIPLFRMMMKATPGSAMCSVQTLGWTHWALGYSNGWTATCAYISGPHLVDRPAERERASFFLACYNVLGVLMGTLFIDMLLHINYFSSNGRK